VILHHRRPTLAARRAVRSRCSIGTFAPLVLAVLLGSLALPTRAQVNWSGDNLPTNGGSVDASRPVVFEYSLYDPGRTEPDGRGQGLGAALFWRDADAKGMPYSQVPMHYLGQTGPYGPNNDLFSVIVEPAAFGAARRIQYFTVAYDSIAVPVYADTTRADANGAPPPFVFTLQSGSFRGPFYVHFSVCLNGETASSLGVRLDPGTGNPPLEVRLVQVAPDQIPDLWEGDVWVDWVAPTFSYFYRKDGSQEGDGTPILRSFTVQGDGLFQGHGTDAWRNGPLGCHLGESLSAPLKVHFSLCLVGTTYSGGVCISGNTLELGNFGAGVELHALQPVAAPDLYEGDVTFATGGPAVVQYKFRVDDCATWEEPFGNEHQITNRFLYLGGQPATYIPPTAVWAYSGPNRCGPPTGVERRSWTNVKRLFR
jgi:hypothetical protein